MAVGITRALGGIFGARAFGYNLRRLRHRAMRLWTLFTDSFEIFFAYKGVFPPHVSAEKHKIRA